MGAAQANTVPRERDGSFTCASLTLLVAIIPGLITALVLSPLCSTESCV